MPASKWRHIRTTTTDDEMDDVMGEGCSCPDCGAHPDELHEPECELVPERLMQDGGKP